MAEELVTPEESLANQMKACADARDFEGAFRLVQENAQKLQDSISKRKISAVDVRDLVLKAAAANDREIASFIDSAGFEAIPFSDALVRLQRLLSFRVGAKVLAKAWGYGEVKRIDDFYRRITVDFDLKKGHQFSYAAAIDMLTVAPENHILTMRHCNRDAYEQMLKERKGDFVIAVIKSYGGELTLQKLENICEQYGMVKMANWKSFWSAARAELRANKLVEIPAKRSEPIRVHEEPKEGADLIESFRKDLARETDPKLILAAVRDFYQNEKPKEVDDATRSVIGDRLSFALTAACKVDNALYARLAVEITKLGFTNPPADVMRTYLKERKRFVKAAVALPARDVGSMIEFIADGAESRELLYKSIPELCFTAVCEVVQQFGRETECRMAVGNLLRQPKAPATLITLIVGKYEQFKDWAELPSLISCLTHAIALGEGRQGGEVLKMQNMVRRLFGDRKWLEKMFAWLTPEEKVLFFERFQASIAWDPSTHHTIVIRMTKLVPELESHLVKVEKKKEYARLTSFRSFGLRKQEYLKLINEDMPANIKRIEFAKGYGDLSENSEYQYAKDEQRALMHKQTVMQEELEAVKPTDFADATTEEVMPGVTVVTEGKDGEKTWTILGEWDNDLDRGIISSLTRLAKNILGKKVGDSFESTDAEGVVSFATVKQILPLSDEVREWMKLPAGIQI